MNFVSMDIKKKFGNRVKALRLELKMSQETLAEEAELDRTYIPGIERGQRNVSITVIEKIAKAFKMKIIDLLKDIEE